jgi:hypothetical protein
VQAVGARVRVTPAEADTPAAGGRPARLVLIGLRERLDAEAIARAVGATMEAGGSR